jgi:hypothetical protein
MTKLILNSVKLNSRINILLNILIFNLFLMGFILNCISIINHNWVLTENDSYGLLEYCKISIEKIDLSLFDFKFHSFFKAKYKIKKLEFEDYNCFYWSSYNKPSKFYLK